MSLKDDVFATDDRQLVPVATPEWPAVDGKLYLRSLSAGELDDFEADSLERNGDNREVNLANMRARLCALCLCDADGNQVFTGDDIPALGRKSARCLGRIFARAQQMNGMTKADREELLKNSAAGRAGSSPSK